MTDQEGDMPPVKRPKLSPEEPANALLQLKSDIDFSEDVTNATDGDLQVNNDSYIDFANDEKLDKLLEFEVLDEVKSNEDESNDDSDSSDGKSEGLPEEEIEKMLEEDLPEGFKGAPKPKEKVYFTRQKIVLEDKGVNHFEVLPLDWMVVRHYSGMPVYMHRPTRVCTLSKPYFLGEGNTRRHDIPISAVPCLAYRRALEEEEKQKEIDRKIEEQIKNGTWVRYTEKQTSIADQESKVKLSELKMMSNVGASINVPSIEPRENKVEKIEDNGETPSDIETPPIVGATKCPFQLANATPTEANDALISIKDIKVENDASSQQSDTDSHEINMLLRETKTENQSDEIPLNSANVTQPSDDNSNVEEDMSEIPLNRKPVELPGGIVMPPPRVETVNTSWKTQHLNHEEINKYCKTLFKFKTVNIMQFRRWADRRKYTKARKTLQYPTLPEGTKLITIPAQAVAGQENGNKSTKRDWVMNMNGRSYLSVFHEYVRRALQKQPVYEFKQLENAASPYQATVYIGGMQYGVGHGSSKRQAKSSAARASIHILIPEMKDELELQPKDSQEPDFSFFDYVGIEDPRITEFCASTCEPSPHAILRTCLLRNFGAGDTHIHTEIKKLEHQNQKIELTMKVGKHTATVVCKNKKTAKQRASQTILQALHPHIRSWGSLLRLYGSRSVKSCKERKLEEQQITLLQDKARRNEPNYAVLHKLRHEMRRLRAMDRAVVPIGTVLLPHRPPAGSGSNLNNVDL